MSENFSSCVDKGEFPNSLKHADMFPCIRRNPKLAKQTTCQFAYFQTCSSYMKCSRSEVFLGKSALKICSKFTGEHPCRSLISIMLLSNFIEITIRHGYSSVNLLHIFRIPFPENTSGRLL